MLFPTLAGKRFVGPVGLDDYYARWVRVRYYTTLNPSPVLKPALGNRMLADLHHDLRAEWSWGGLYEDRSRMWRGGYMKETRAYMHLGVDLNVPAGTPVCADSAGEVVLVDNDIGEVGGWGTRVVIRLFHHPLLLIYAHLAPAPACAYAEPLKAGDILLQGQEFARVGAAPHNGGWFSHLHLQAVTASAWERYARNLTLLDGYGRAADMERLREEFPDPMPYVRLL